MELWLQKVINRTEERSLETKNTANLSELIEASRESGLPLAEVEARCLEAGVTPQRYARNMGTLGEKGQIRLLRGHFAVAGCGGLGGLIIDLLARTGLGKLTLADGDHFSESNLNRQILCTTATLNQPKADVAKKHVELINPATQVRTMRSYLDAENLSGFLQNVDLVFDALDNNKSRKMLFQYCSERGIPVIHGAIGGFWGQVQNVHPGDKTLLDLTPEEDIFDRGIEVRTGNPPFTPAMIASLQVSEALKLFLGLGKNIPKGSMLWVDLSNSEFSTFALTPGAGSSP